MGHGINGCSIIDHKMKELPKDELPYFLALKAEFNFPSKVSMRLGAKIKKKA